MTNTWLITGGAGCIGAHVVRALPAASERPVVYDDLSTGIAERVPAGVPLVAGSTLDAALLRRTPAEHAVTGVVHLAAKKQVGEWLVRATGRATGLATASLRSFNVAGAATPELADVGVFNIVPMVFEELTEGSAPRIFGADYPTPDGTCVRDYIHVVDLAEAHVATARALAASPGRDLTLNIGRARVFRSTT
ncbi:NAD-dependent epimerase/dehydratase [Actinobacteria bacterium OK074]|nr:NAD-dependent epimerase/dehydratase [Actinobacteria bacterium OK074]